MAQPIPTGEFDWLTDEEIAEIDFTDGVDDNKESYILEVDLHDIKELHDLHNDYPLSPEKMRISSEMLLRYCRDVTEGLRLRVGVVSKLVPNLQDKTYYVIHYRNLKQYLALDMVKVYIDFNTEKRTHVANDVEKDFYKLMNNSVFGRPWKIWGNASQARQRQA